MSLGIFESRSLTVCFFSEVVVVSGLPLEVVGENRSVLLVRSLSVLVLVEVDSVEERKPVRMMSRLVVAYSPGLNDGRGVVTSVGEELLQVERCQNCVAKVISRLPSYPLVDWVAALNLFRLSLILLSLSGFSAVYVVTFG